MQFNIFQAVIHGNTFYFRITSKHFSSSLYLDIIESSTDFSRIVYRRVSLMIIKPLKFLSFPIIRRGHSTSENGPISQHSILLWYYKMDYPETWSFIIIVVIEYRISTIIEFKCPVALCCSVNTFDDFSDFGANRSVGEPVSKISHFVCLIWAV
jgi:hypothetical protein